jgi:protein-tyrosine phosphatase
MAEAVFQEMVAKAGLSEQIMVESAGTGAFHIGEPAHHGTRRVLVEHGIQYRGCAQQITAVAMQADNTYIIAMDESNIRNLTQRFGEHPRLYRLLDFATKTHEKNVPDPYYTGNFELVYDLVENGCRGLLQFLNQELMTEI